MDSIAKGLDSIAKGLTFIIVLCPEDATRKETQAWVQLTRKETQAWVELTYRLKHSFSLDATRKETPFIKSVAVLWTRSQRGSLS